VDWPNPLRGLIERRRRVRARPRILFHVGSAKTGSTAIQETLTASSPGLRKIGIVYPTLGEKVDHSILIPAILEEDEYLHNFCRDDPGKKALGTQESEEKWAKLAEIVRTTPADTVVLSSEYAFGIRPASAHRLVGRLKDLTDDVEACAYVREPCDHYLSATQQILKYGRRIKDPRTPQTYCGKLGKFEALLPGKVHKRLFERESLHRQDITLDLLSRILPDEVIAKADIATASTNVSLSAEAMSLLQTFNHTVWGDARKVGHPVNKRILDAIGAEERGGGYTRARLRDEIARVVILANARDVLALRDRHGLGFARFDYDLAASATDDEIAGIASRDDLSDLRVTDVVAFDAYRAQELTMRVMAKLAQGAAR